MEANDWDLFAVVRGCGFFSTETSGTTTSDVNIIDPFSSFKEGLKEEKFLNFSGFCEGDESEKLFSLDIDTTRLQPKKRLTQTPRLKRSRKNQLQKVVRHVPVSDGVSSDLWAWRKYGQKPIKGSPYPRGYYRCSSLKGCIARKQVERDPSDPSMFIITYTGDHNHAVPTHRNSLAGISRPKFPPVSSAQVNAELSPVTPLTGDVFGLEEEINEDGFGIETRVFEEDDHDVWFNMGFDGFEDQGFLL